MYLVVYFVIMYCSGFVFHDFVLDVTLDAFLDIMLFDVVFQKSTNIVFDVVVLLSYISISE